jgi:DNA-binding ferritin-like protein
VAHHLAERLVHLDLSPYDRAQVLVRHVRALCALSDVSSAQKILEELTRIYPNSEPAARARAMVVEAATKTHSR